MKSPRLLYNIQWTVCHIQRSVSHPRNSFKNTLKDCFKDFFKDSFKDSLQTRMLRSPMLLFLIQRQVCSFTMSNNEGLKWRKTLTQAISGSHLSLDVHFLFFVLENAVSRVVDDSPDPSLSDARNAFSQNCQKMQFLGSSVTVQTRLLLTQDVHFLICFRKCSSRVLNLPPKNACKACFKASIQDSFRGSFKASFKASFKDWSNEIAQASVSHPKNYV